MKKKWPNPIPPAQRLCVDRRTAACLLSVSSSLFSKRVRDGDYPQPIRGHLPPRWLVEDLIRFLLADLLGDKQHELSENPKEEDWPSFEL
jgi:hypothetical protein